MIELDFLFVYEHKVRELENLCLMKYELDRRGYRTKIVYVDDAQNAVADKPIYHTKVLCTMACYDNYTLFWHTKEFVKFEKVIDLQWENIVYPKDEEREEAYKNYWGIGKDVIHVSWGRQNVKRLLNAAHPDEKKVKLTGHVGMDFLRAPLNQYYLSKEEIFSKYDISMNKKVILFASPYYGDCLTQEYIDGMCRAFGDDWTEYYQFMCESQKIVLEWFEKNLSGIYRYDYSVSTAPGHPSIMAEELSKKYENFRIISGESVKQWIVICDKVYTGNSSVVVEAFFAQKMCQLLFPIPTTPGFELQLIADSSKVTTYKAFYQSVITIDEIFPTPEKSIEDIYLIDWETPNYVKFADMAEEVLQDDSYCLTKRQLREYKEYSFAEQFIKWIMKIKPLYSLYHFLLSNEHLQWSFLVKQRKLREKNKQVAIENEQRHAHELTSEKEIQAITNRIKYALESNIS